MVASEAAATTAAVPSTETGTQVDEPRPVKRRSTKRAALVSSLSTLVDTIRETPLAMGSGDAAFVLSYGADLELTTARGADRS